MDVLKGAPKLEDTAEIDSARIDWMMKVADLFEKMKISREQLKSKLEQTERLDSARIDWWLDQAEKYKNEKPTESNQ